MSNQKVAVFGTNRVRQVFVAFTSTTKEFEDRLEAELLKAKERKQSFIMIDANVAFYLDDFYTKGQYTPYKRMRVLSQAEFIASLNHQKNFLKAK